MLPQSWLRTYPECMDISIFSSLSSTIRICFPFRSNDFSDESFTSSTFSRYFSSSVKLKLLPLCNSLSRLISESIIWISLRLIARPNPVPSPSCYLRFYVCHASNSGNKILLFFLRCQFHHPALKVEAGFSFSSQISNIIFRTFSWSIYKVRGVYYLLL